MTCLTRQRVWSDGTYSPGRELNHSGVRNVRELKTEVVLMADRSLKGTGLGAKSFEDEAGVEFAARQEVGYDCPRDHHFSLVFAAEADIPSVWECPRCGAESLRSDGERPELKEEKPPRTHWDMLRERRSIAELEDLLAERLNQLRSGELGSTALSRSTRPKKTA
jgi:hypothetical protein